MPNKKTLEKYQKFLDQRINKLEYLIECYKNEIQSLIAESMIVDDLIFQLENEIAIDRANNNNYNNH